VSLERLLDKLEVGIAAARIRHDYALNDIDMILLFKQELIQLLWSSYVKFVDITESL
jgi:hypothetical protein